MKPDFRSKLTTRFVLSALVTLLVTFGIDQSRMFAIESSGDGPPSTVTRLQPQNLVAKRGARNVRTFEPAAGPNLYMIGAAQVIGLDIICDAKVTNGGWGHTIPGLLNTTSGKATFGGSATGARNGSADGQQQYSDHNDFDAFDVHSTIVTDVMCSNDGTHATILGQARVTKLSTFQNLDENFQIDLDDVDKTGSGNDTYHIQLRGIFVYDSGVMDLQGGNVVIHKQ